MIDLISGLYMIHSLCFGLISEQDLMISMMHRIKTSIAHGINRGTTMVIYISMILTILLRNHAAVIQHSPKSLHNPRHPFIRIICDSDKKVFMQGQSFVLAQ
jgi:hypothetical protein